MQKINRMQSPERPSHGQDAGPSTLAPVAPAGDAYATLPCVYAMSVLCKSRHETGRVWYK